MDIIRITNDECRLVAPEGLARAKHVHRELRPELPSGYADGMRRIFDGGGEMCVAVIDADVVGVAVFRNDRP